MVFSAYVICATPRSGSTLLCDLLAASNVAGRPHSYLRAEDINYWAELWGVDGAAAAADPEFNRKYVAAMVSAGTAATGIFGLRLMWASIGEATVRLEAALGRTGDLASRFERAFGPTLFIHLSRRDKQAQAVSLVRARQTGLWHVASDGSERERTAPAREALFCADEIRQTSQRLMIDDRAWSSLFDLSGVRPWRLWYEDLAADPRMVLADLLAALGRDRKIAASIEPQTAKMADATSLSWLQQLRSE